MEFRVWGLGFRVWGLGFRVCLLTLARLSLDSLAGTVSQALSGASEPRDLKVNLGGCRVICGLYGVIWGLYAGYMGLHKVFTSCTDFMQVLSIEYDHLPQRTFKDTHADTCSR